MSIIKVDYGDITSGGVTKNILTDTVSGLSANQVVTIATTFKPFFVCFFKDGVTSTSNTIATWWGSIVSKPFIATYPTTYAWQRVAENTYNKTLSSSPGGAPLVTEITNNSVKIKMGSSSYSGTWRYYITDYLDDELTSLISGQMYPV